MTWTNIIVQVHVILHISQYIEIYSSKQGQIRYVYMYIDNRPGLIIQTIF